MLLPAADNKIFAFGVGKRFALRGGGKSESMIYLGNIISSIFLVANPLEIDFFYYKL